MKNRLTSLFCLSLALAANLAEANVVSDAQTQVCPYGYNNELDCGDISYQIFRGARAAGMENAQLIYKPNSGGTFRSGRVTLIGKRRRCTIDIVGYTVLSHCS